MNPPTDIARLRALLEAATPGPWSEDDGNIFSDPLSEARHAAIMARLHGEGVPHPDEGLDGPLGFIVGDAQQQPNCDADCDLIVESRNALPDLLDEVERLREERARLLEALEDMVAQHCGNRGLGLDSLALSANADAMHLLADLNRLEITREAGRRVLGKWRKR